MGLYRDARVYIEVIPATADELNLRFPCLDP